jgi:hypothetical protein
MQEMGAQARKVYESKYTGQVNYGRLMQIYEDAIRSRAGEPTLAVESHV